MWPGSWYLVPVGLLLTACAGTGAIDDASKIELRDDHFRPEIEYTTGTIQTATTNGLGSKRLLATVDRKSGALTHVVLAFQIGYTGTGRRSYEIANDASAKSLRLSTVTRNSSCDRQGTCTYVESYLVEIAEAEIRAAFPRGGGMS